MKEIPRLFLEERWTFAFSQLTIVLPSVELSFPAIAKLGLNTHSLRDPVEYQSAIILDQESPRVAHFISTSNAVSIKLFSAQNSDTIQYNHLAVMSHSCLPAFSDSPIL
jgi:hypothetical protein